MVPPKPIPITSKEFWSNGEPSQEEIDVIYKRKPRALFTIANFADGTSEKIWCTSDEQQIDIKGRRIEMNSDYLR